MQCLKMVLICKGSQYENRLFIFISGCAGPKTILYPVESGLVKKGFSRVFKDFQLKKHSAHSTMCHNTRKQHFITHLAMLQHSTAPHNWGGGVQRKIKICENLLKTAKAKRPQL